MIHEWDACGAYNLGGFATARDAKLGRDLCGETPCWGGEKATKCYIAPRMFMRMARAANKDIVGDSEA